MMQRATCAQVWQVVDDSCIPHDVVARYLKCHPQYLRDLRFGHVKMSAPMRAKICHFLGRSEEELFGEYLRQSAVLEKERS
jgi:hypothetical protein